MSSSPVPWSWATSPCLTRSKACVVSQWFCCTRAFLPGEGARRKPAFPLPVTCARPCLPGSPCALDVVRDSIVPPSPAPWTALAFWCAFIHPACTPDDRDPDPASVNPSVPVLDCFPGPAAALFQSPSTACCSSLGFQTQGFRAFLLFYARPRITWMLCAVARNFFAFFEIGILRVLLDLGRCRGQREDAKARRGTPTNGKLVQIGAKCQGRDPGFSNERFGTSPPVCGFFARVLENLRKAKNERRESQPPDPGIPDARKGRIAE